MCQTVAIFVGLTATLLDFISKEDFRFPILFYPHLICQFNCQAERFINLTDNGTLDELSVVGRNLGRAVS